MGENEEELFLLNSLKELTPFIRLIIDELAGLIQNKKRRELFLYVVMKGSIREYSNEIGIRCTEAQKEFNSILREIKSRAGFLKTYREDLYRLRCCHFTKDHRAASQTRNIGRREYIVSL